MPTYEFRCPAGHEFERFFQRISDAPREVPCQECRQPAERLISGGAGLLFKGSGFYITDYGKDGKKDQRERASSRTGTDGKAASGGDSAGSGGDSGSKSPGSGESGAGKSSGSTTSSGGTAGGGSSSGNPPAGGDK